MRTDLRFFNKLPGDVDAVGLWTMLCLDVGRRMFRQEKLEMLGEVVMNK